MYLTLEEYTAMGGILDGATFKNYLHYAENYINNYTFNRLKNDKNIPLPVKQCAFEIIRLVEEKYKTLTAKADADTTIASQSNDGVSVRYNVVPATTLLSTIDSEIKNVCKLYLYGVKNELGQMVTYRGVYPNE